MPISSVDFPVDWFDDVRMNFLFSPFKEKYVNPEGWESKMKFWTSLIQRICLKTKSPIVNQDILNSIFERKGRQPQCLDVVLEHMNSQNMVVSLSEFSKIERSWLGWGFEVVQKPVKWGFSTVQGLLKWAKKDERYVLLPVVKELAARILQRHSEMVKSELVDNIIFLELFEDQCKDICSDLSFTCAVNQLQKDHCVHVFEDNGRKIIKFRKSTEKQVQVLSEVDKGVLSLRKARDSLSKDVDKLEEEIKSLTAEIKELLKVGSKTKAMFILKRKKRLEAILAKKSTAFDNIEDLLCQLQNSGSEKMVLDAYRCGVIAMKSSMKIDLNIDKIDETMASVEEAVDDYSEVQKTLSRNVVSDNESLEEFENELADILAAESATEKRKIPEAKLKVKSRSSENTHEDLMRRLEALRSPPDDSPPAKKPTERRQLTSM